MCGIFGYIGKEYVDLKGATDIITHRGPDAEGFLGYDIEQKKISKDINDCLAISGPKLLLGFRRLSIIDLSSHADQPFSDPQRGLHITFNGEIYNYIEIRKELEAKGYNFRTKSDTEVLMYSYAEWGESCVEHFNGMWAFAILDEKMGKLFCSRDRFGVKPFYYAQLGQGLVWGSEIKQLFVAGVPKIINEDVIRDFLDRSLADHTYQTFFKGIYQLLAGHSFTIDIHNTHNAIQPKILRHWELLPDDQYQNITYQDAQSEFKRLFSDSVKLRFRSDVPVGSCLSGGLDSSSIVTVAATMFDTDINTFTSRFESKKFDESYFANLVNTKYKNVVPHFCSLNEEILQSEIDELIYHQDEPFGTFGIMAQWEVMKLAKQNDVIVLLDGQGGDELLGGYRKYYAFFLKELVQRHQYALAAKNAFYLVKNKEFNFFNKEGIYRYLGLTNKLNYLSDLGKQLKPGIQIGLGSVSDMNGKAKQDIEHFSYPPLLRFEDRNSMAHSIETRVPFMDYRLVRFIYSLPATYKIREGYTKALLRDSLKGLLPEETRTRISKLGFATPQSDWMGDKLNTYFASYFRTMNNPYLDNKAISDDFGAYPNSKLHSWDFSRLFIFDRWYQQHFN
ncbi:MAG: asparagine synthase (glutamine-hydrolyzing) [Bacteroidota bacterium]